MLDIKGIIGPNDLLFFILLYALVKKLYNVSPFMCNHIVYNNKKTKTYITCFNSYLVFLKIHKGISFINKISIHNINIFTNEFLKYIITNI
jgi:hypothetical protein